MTSLALFDLDNTLLNREEAFALWTHLFLEAYGLGESAVSTIQIADADGYNPREQFFSELRREFGITTPVDQLLADYSVQYPSHYAAVPKMIDAVRSLRAAGFKIGVVTNGPLPNGQNSKPTASKTSSMPSASHRSSGHASPI